MLPVLISVMLLASGSVVAADLGETVAFRKQYNRVASRIDSLVRAMQAKDVGALQTDRLPDGRDVLRLPNDTQVVAIFWADDEAKIWINDYFVGETRLTPVEVVIPELYLRSTNVVRVRGWDTDYVESGFLFGLYLRRQGRLHAIVVSDDSWEGIGGPVESIMYAHSLPDIPSAEVIWGTRTFGVVEMQTWFDAGSVRQAGQDAGADPVSGVAREMSLHRFVAKLAVLETERDRLSAELRKRSVALSVPAYRGTSVQGSLTLGKAGPLEEGTTQPVANKVRTWSDKLPREQRSLIYPDRRVLRGEAEATHLGDLVTGAAGGTNRADAYTPPSDRRNTAPGSQDGSSGSGTAGAEGEEEAGSHTAGGGGGFAGRASRLGLLVPALILATYAVYATRQWRRMSLAG